MRGVDLQGLVLSGPIFGLGIWAVLSAYRLTPERFEAERARERPRSRWTAMVADWGLTRWMLLNLSFGTNRWIRLMLGLGVAALGGVGLVLGARGNFS